MQCIFVREARFGLCSHFSVCNTIPACNMWVKSGVLMFIGV